MTLYFLYKHWKRSKLWSKVGDFCYYLDILVIPGNSREFPGMEILFPIPGNEKFFPENPTLVVTFE